MDSVAFRLYISFQRSTPEFAYDGRSSLRYFA